LAAALACAACADAFAESELLRAAKLRLQNRDNGDSRIIGGRDTTIRENPWQVALLNAEDKDDDRRAQFCGGVIVHPSWVLTAGHCVGGGTKEADVEVLSGTERLDQRQKPRLAVESIRLHEDYKKVDGVPHFDIALLKVKGKLDGMPIAPPAKDIKLVEGLKIWVTGWGVNEKAGTTNYYHLQGVHVTVIDQNYCNNDRVYNKLVTDSMFCAGIRGRLGGGGRDACQGDSGGPVTVGVVAAARLVGLVSWGKDCAMPYKYGVYTRLQPFIAWVKDRSGGEVVWQSE
jgi:secreted trypsin-like serine protease